MAKELNNLLVMTTDSLQLLGHASYEISQLRRDEIKPNLHKDYGDLCSSNIPVTELLFGDELQTQLTHIRATNKLAIRPANHPTRKSNRITITAGITTIISCTTNPETAEQQNEELL